MKTTSLKGPFPLLDTFFNIYMVVLCWFHGLGPSLCFNDQHLRLIVIRSGDEEVGLPMTVHLGFPLSPMLFTLDWLSMLPPCHIVTFYNCMTVSFEWGHSPGYDMRVVHDTPTHPYSLVALSCLWESCPLNALELVVPQITVVFTCPSGPFIQLISETHHGKCDFRLPFLIVWVQIVILCSSQISHYSCSANSGMDTENSNPCACYIVLTATVSSSKIGFVLLSLCQPYWLEKKNWFSSIQISDKCWQSSLVRLSFNDKLWISVLVLYLYIHISSPPVFLYLSLG